MIVDLHDILLEFPGATAVLKVRPPDEKAAYPAVTETIDDKLCWSISDSDTAKEGRGELQLSLISPTGSKIKTAVAAMEISRSLPDGGQKPDRIDDWMEKAEVARKKAEEAASNADTKANLANDAATKANEATSKANTAASNADTKAKLANDAATNADTATNNANTATTEANEAATKATDAAKRAEDAAEKADKACQNTLIGSETGNTVSVSDAFSAPLCGLTVYGKSTQDGTPSPDTPVPIVSAGDGGSVTVTLSDGNGKTQTLTLPTPNGLPGIPVTSGGNYTDKNGQQWICDEIDLTRDVRVQRTGSYTLQNVIISSISTNVYRISYADEIIKMASGTVYSLLCTTYTNNHRSQWANENNPISWSGEPYRQLRVYDSRDQAEILKTLNSGNVRIDYVLDDPIETPLTPAEIATYKALTTYAPDTVVQASDGAGLKLDYQRDVNIVIKNLEDAIASMTTT